MLKIFSKKAQAITNNLIINSNPSLLTNLQSKNFARNAGSKKSSNKSESNEDLEYLKKIKTEKSNKFMSGMIHKEFDQLSNDDINEYFDEEIAKNKYQQNMNQISQNPNQIYDSEQYEKINKNFIKEHLLQMYSTNTQKNSFDKLKNRLNLNDDNKADNSIEQTINNALGNNDNDKYEDPLVPKPYDKYISDKNTHRKPLEVEVMNNIEKNANKNKFTRKINEIDIIDNSKNKNLISKQQLKEEEIVQDKELMNLSGNMNIIKQQKKDAVKSKSIAERLNRNKNNELQKLRTDQAYPDQAKKLVQIKENIEKIGDQKIANARHFKDLVEEDINSEKLAVLNNIKKQDLIHQLNRLKGTNIDKVSPTGPISPREELKEKGKLEKI